MSSTENVAAEALPSMLNVTESVVILCVWCTALLLLSAVLGWQAWKRRVRLSVLPTAYMLLAVTVSTVVLWAVIVSEESDVLTQHSHRLLLAAGNSVNSATRAELSEGVAMVQRISELVGTGVLNTASPFPSLHRNLWALFRSPYEEALASSVYIGMETGSFALTGGRGAEEAHVVVGTPPLHCSAEGLRQWSEGSGCTPAIELQCGGDQVECEHPACGDATGGCSFCRTVMGSVSCDGCACAMWVPPALEAYTVPANSTVWSLPPLAMSRGGFCFREPPAGAEATNVTGQDGTAWYGGRSFLGEGGCGSYYDARIRPWYRRDRTVGWTTPYLYSSGLVWGVTVSVSIPNPDYRGTQYTSGTPSDPRDTPWLGVVGMDYTLPSITPFLQRASPSPNAMLSLVDSKGNVFGTSSLPQGVTQLTVNSPEFAHRDAFLRLQKRFGGLAKAAEQKVIIQGDGMFDLAMPIEIPGNLQLILVISMPHSDVDGDAAGASSAALGLVVGLSVVFALVGLAMNQWLLRPLQLLKEGMRRVAVMDLSLEVPRSVTREMSEMSEHFEMMVAALEEYRMHLPAAVLGGLQADPLEEAPTGCVTIVFTDIVGSTRLWELAPVTMAEALQQHNNIARELIAKHRGYEVKTIGDSFMIAFDDPVNAVLFAVHFQEELLAAEWPEEEAFDDVREYVPEFDDDGAPVWNGMPVRIGMASGECQHEVNPMTGRVDYRGRVVNLAARLESSAHTGLVMVSQECSEAVANSKEVSVEKLPAKELKGLGSVVASLALTPPLMPRRKVHRLRSSSKRRPTTLNPLRMRGARMDVDRLDDTMGRRMSRISMNSKVSKTSSLISGLAQRVIEGAHTLTRRQATVAVVTNLDLGRGLSLNTNTGELSEALTASMKVVVTTAVRFQGVVQSVQGSWCLAYWNVTTPCADHQFQGIAFGSVVSDADEEISVGLGSGTLHDGHVGIARQRFYSVFGLPVPLAAAASRAASEHRSRCLAVFVPETPPGFHNCLEISDVWGVPLEDHVVEFTVEEVSSGAERARKASAAMLGMAGECAVDPSRNVFRQSVLNVIRTGSTSALEDIVDDSPCRSVLIKNLKDHITAHPNGRAYRILVSIGAVTPNSRRHTQCSIDMYETHVSDLELEPDS
eukprot:Hpha_TRINITY_DN15223_c4_g5::TRINITY_DN15223_c4_g5_i1::g.67162::m.67162